MSKVIYGAWGDEVVDNRGKNLADVEPHPRFRNLEFYEPGNRLLALVGWNGFYVLDERVDIIDMLRQYLEIIQKEVSCGKCIPGRMGTKVALDILKRIAEGRGEYLDIERLERLRELTYNCSMCEVGHTSMIPLHKVMVHFPEYLRRSVERWTPVQKVAYHWKVTAPCIEACPVHIDIPKYIEYIKQGYYTLSLATIQERNPLAAICGRVCVRYCEFACRRSRIDNPVSIKHLKRFVAELTYAHEHEDVYKEIPKMPPSGKKIAIVGAGPAGLAAAYYLLKRGHEVDIYEASDRPGGMMVWGIPPFRLPRSIVKREVEVVERMGGKFFFNKRLGKDFTLTELKQKYDAIFVAIGAQLPRKMNIPGEDPKPLGYYTGLEFLKRYNSGQELYLGKRAVVVGGGNVAMDCCRTAKRLGVEEVTVVYRRTEAEMPADKEEYEAARKEGIKFIFLANPVEILVENGRVVGVKCVRMKLGEPDASGRRRPEPIPGSEFVIETDLIIPAIGQKVDTSWLEYEEGLNISLTRWGTIKVDPVTLMSDELGIFAGGDCVLGPATLIEAEAAGMKVALYIDQFVKTGKIEVPDEERLSLILRETGLYKEEQLIDFVTPEFGEKLLVEKTPLQIKKELSPEEIEITPEEALLEADRCLRCYKVILVATER